MKFSERAFSITRTFYTMLEIKLFSAPTSSSTKTCCRLQACKYSITCRQKLKMQEAIDFNLISVFLLMYADDMVLLSESPESLQVLLNSLYNYNTQWNLTLNSDKTKIMVFRNGGNLRENEKWFYNGSELETVNEFNTNYL